MKDTIRRVSLFALVGWTFSLCAGSTALASDPESFARFRLLTNTGDRLAGRNARLTADSLTASDVAGRRLVLSRQQIRALDVSDGTNAGRGAAIGAGLGLLTGLLAALQVGMDDRNQLDGSAAVAVTAGLTAAGGLIGLAVGSSSTRWRSLPTRTAALTPEDVRAEDRVCTVSVCLRF